jgi:hypothetical protein
LSEFEHDPDTAALEGQLNAAFASARPRAEFEDELWQKIRAKGGFTLRVREAWAGINRGPLIASAAGLAALVLVAVIAMVSLRVGGTTQQTATSGAARAPGYVPAPALKATTGGAAPADAQAPSVIPYYGPADLSWSGVLPTLPATAPVLTFEQPSPDALSMFTTEAALPDGYAFSFDLTGPEPRYSIDNQSQTSPGGLVSDQDARRLADQFLAAHRLSPAWAADVVVSRGVADVAVNYYRQFPVPGAGPAVQIDQSGNRTGIRVLIAGGPTVMHVDGPLPLTARTTPYPLRQPDTMVSAALGAPAATEQTIGGTRPQVALNRATLVYIAVRPGYYEPALLFTGSFAIGNQLYEKRVLVPAIDPSRLQR